MKALPYLIIALLLCVSVPLRASGQGSPHGWKDTTNGWFVGSGSGLLDFEGTHTGLRSDGQMFHMIGMPSGNSQYYMQCDWGKLFTPSKDSLLPIPAWSKVLVRIVGDQNVIGLKMFFTYRTPKGASFSRFVDVSYTRAWQEVRFKSDTSFAKFFYSAGISFSITARDSSSAALDVMVKNLTLEYGDSTRTLDLMMDTSLISGIAGSERAAILPSSSELMQNYPNPFNPSTTIPYFLREAGDVDLRVYDLLGREIAVVQRGHVPAGTHYARFEAAGLPSGTYLALLRVSGVPAGTRKLTVLK
jgi:hypothetical protein